MCNCTDPMVLGQVGVNPEVPCELITADLLRTYKKPIDCYLQHRLGAQVGASESELMAATTVLQGFIDNKEKDPHYCPEPARMVLVQNLVNRILAKGLCL